MSDQYQYARKILCRESTTAKVSYRWRFPSAQSKGTDSVVRLRNAFLAVLTVCVLVGAETEVLQAQSPPASVRCTAITPKQVGALFDRWDAALATDNPDAVVKNYSTDAVLLPTAANGPLVGPEAIRGYFVHFLARHPRGTIDKRTIRIGCNTVFDAGTYIFTLDGGQPGSRVQLPARYTYVYEPRGGNWLIVHHHSSAMPEQPH
jgi:uncharacterized protein (TIGR02246 family)